MYGTFLRHHIMQEYKLLKVVRFLANPVYKKIELAELMINRQWSCTPAKRFAPINNI